MMKELVHLPRDLVRKVRRAARRHFFPVLDNRESKLTLPPAVVLDAVRHAHRGRRLKLLRRLIPYLSEPRPASPAAVCHIKTWPEFESGYAQLAVMLGRAGKTPPPGEIEFLQAMVNRPSHYPGTIEASDFFFLTAFVSVVAPQRVLEIGTLTGFSAAIIAAALHRQADEQMPKWVDSIDVAPHCFIDKTRPTGFEIEEAFPELAAMIRLHIPHDSTFVGELAQPNELEIAFIDADHQHPLPLLDLLRVAPYVHPGGWIVLHDIQLGTKGRKAEGSDPTLRWGAAAGAELVFESWPFGKISGGNIGAIRLPEEKSALIPFALRLMSVPYEITGNGAKAVHRALHRSFEALI